MSKTFVPLQSLANVTMGQSPEGECVTETERGLPFLQGCAEFGRQHPEPKVFCFPPLRTAKAGSVLISVRAPVGTANFADTDYCIGRGIASIQAKQQPIDNEFLYYALQDDPSFLHRRSQGSTFLAVGSEDILSFPVPEFGGTTRARIATILSTIDAEIEQTEALIVKWQKIKAGMMQDLFTRGVTPDGHLRPTYAEAPHLYKESPLGWIPKEWEIKTTGAVSSSLVPGRDKPELDGGGVPWITIPDIENLYIGESKSGISLSSRAIKAANARLMPKGTVVMSCVGEFGIAAVATQDLIANQQLHGFICDQTILPEWLAIQIIDSGSRIDRMATQTTIKYLNKTGCESIKIAVPRKDEQERGFELLRELMDYLSTLQNQAKKLRQLKSGLMHDLITGRVRVSVPDDEKDAA